MDKTELKKILKPLIKSCIKEVLMEQGLLNIISETRNAPIEENMDVTPDRGGKAKQAIAHPFQSDSKEEEKRKVIQERHKRMMEEIGNSGYLNTGFNPFSSTEALADSQAPQVAGPVNESTNVVPAFKDMNPDDPGVDIRGIMGMANNKVWKSIIGKGK